MLAHRSLIVPGRSLRSILPGVLILILTLLFLSGCSQAPCTFAYQGKQYTRYKVPLPDGTVRTLALLTPGRTFSTFIDPANPQAAPITWDGNWRALPPACPKNGSLFDLPLTVLFFGALAALFLAAGLVTLIQRIIEGPMPLPQPGVHIPDSTHTCICCKTASESGVRQEIYYGQIISQSSSTRSTGTGTVKTTISRYSVLGSTNVLICSKCLAEADLKSNRNWGVFSLALCALWTAGAIFGVRAGQVPNNILWVVVVFGVILGSISLAFFLSAFNVRRMIARSDMEAIEKVAGKINPLPLAKRALARDWRKAGLNAFFSAEEYHRLT